MTSALTVVVHTKYSIRTAHITRNKGAFNGYSLRTSFGKLLLAIGSIIWSLLLPKLLFKLNFSPFSMTRKFKGVVMISAAEEVKIGSFLWIRISLDTVAEVKRSKRRPKIAKKR